MKAPSIPARRKPPRAKGPQVKAEKGKAPPREVSTSMEPVGFVIPGPIGHKQRLRLDRRNLRLYTPDETLAFEHVVAQIGALKFRLPFGGPVRLRLVVVFPIPASWTKAKRERAYMGPCMSKPDLSNIEKAIEDALNGIAYLDDAQIVEKVSRKRYGLVEEMRVEIEPLNPDSWWASPHAQA